MSRRRTNNRKLSVYLIKDEYDDFRTIVNGGTEEYPVTYGGSPVGNLYVKPVPAHTPKWFSLFDGSVPDELREKLKTSIPSAVFLLRQEDRVFAITFGYGRSLLKPGAWEERFGLKVVLNSIDPDKIRVIDRKNLDTMLTHTRTQTSRECDIREFGLDVQQILLKAVTGKPKDPTFAAHVSGADALSIICEATLGIVGAKCGELLGAFSAHDYKTDFGWVDDLSEVKSKQETAELNDELVRGIREGNKERLFLAVPEIIEWANVEGFRFRDNDDETFRDILLPDFLKTVRDRNEISLPYLKQRSVSIVHSDTNVTERRWTVFHCLNCEIEREGNTYILTEGRWYQINTSFVARVNERVARIDKYSISLPAKRLEKESCYCKRLYETATAHYALMDRRIIRYGGGYGQIEFCDLFTLDKTLIHIKRYAGSSVLSHLFAQGANSARALLLDAEFRKEVIAELPPTHKFSADEKPSDYEIVFGIISERADDLPGKLPFFSKLTLMRVSDELQYMMPFKVSFAGIRVVA